MTLRNRDFERSIRRQIDLTIRRSPALRREERRVRRARRADVSQAVSRSFATFLFLASMAKLGAHGATLDAMLALLTIWCASFAFHYANRLRFRLCGAPEILVLALQPLRDERIFSHQWQGFARLSLWLLADVSGALAVVSWFAQANPVQWITALPCALALWIATIAVAALLVRLRPGANFGAMASGLLLLVATTVVAGYYAPEVVGRLLDGASSPFYTVPPFGWICYVVRESVFGQELLPLLLLLPVALLVLALQHARKRLAAHYQLFTADDSESFDDFPADSEPGLPGNVTNRSTSTADPEQVQFIAEAWSRPRLSWAQDGLVEQAIARWLTPREQDIADFLTAGVVDWTANLRRSSILVFAALLAAYSLGPSGLWLCYVGLYFAATTGVPIFGTPCVGLSVIQMAGTSFPAYAGLPLGFHEIARVLLKVGIVRTLIFSPVALIAGTLVGHLAVGDWKFGLQTSAKIVALLLCWQPSAIALQFSIGTNDTGGPAWRSLKLLAAIGPLLAGSLAASAGTIFGPTSWALGCLFANAIFSWAAFQLYGRFYNRNAFDLMHGQAQ